MDNSRPFHLAVTSERSLHGVVHTAARSGPRPTIVICHGFKGFMEWGFFPNLADLLSARGFTVVRFNFSGSGMEPGDELVTDLDAFCTATFSQDLEELLALLAALDESVAPGHVDRTRLGIFGHSRGGGTALLAAAHPDWSERLGALVTWSAVSTFDRLSDDEKTSWRQQGWLPVVNARTGQELKLNRVVLEDLESHSEDLDLFTAAARRRAPWLIVHGTDDETVPVEEAKDLAEAAAGSGELIEIAGASHTFGANHPFDGPSPQLITVLNETQLWFREHLEQTR